MQSHTSSITTRIARAAIAIFTFTAASFASSPPVKAGEDRAVPATIAFQGFLTDGSGIPLTTTVDLILTIYDDAGPSGIPLWSESQPGVSVTDGIFAISIGDATPLPADLFDGTPRWLGIRVDGGVELFPRLRRPFSSGKRPIRPGTSPPPLCRRTAVSALALATGRSAARSRLLPSRQTRR